MTFTKTILSLAITLAATTVMANDLPINQPEKNQWLIDSVYPTSHHNPAQTDASPIAGPSEGKVLKASDVKTIPGLFNSQPVVKNIGDQRILIEGGILGLRKINATGEKFEEISFMPYPGFEKYAEMATESELNDIVKELDKARSAHDDAAILKLSKRMQEIGFSFRTIANGVYHLIDKDHNHYAVYGGVNVIKTTDNGVADAPLSIVKTADITASLPENLRKQVTRVVGIGMTYDGDIAVAAPGMIALLDRDLNMKGYVTFPGEHVDNSIAIDETGIYAVTSENMYKVVWTGDKLSFDEKDGGWISPYDTIDAETALKMGAASRGSGTTPALMGFGDDEDKLVLISDADREGAKLVAFWRDEIPADFKQIPGTDSRRIAGEIRIDVSDLTVETSPVVNGYGTVLFNGAYKEPSSALGDIFGNMFTAGVTRLAPRGIQKFEWDPESNTFSKTWTDISTDNSDWMVPVVSAKSNMIYTPSKTGLRYEYVGLDWTTGEVKARWPMPTTSSHYNLSLGIAYFLDDGDMIVGGYFDTKRIDFNRK
ncbi:hypothetical protein RGQ13_09370 [Thalassotalea psychrophila]|uniref:Uncharacterized protein n=1 Tax=Thalassotalea psychrophila TaxID=3065647 RepID=A0ABY9TZA0_9GAMM|nr:hypothetical protein RGQ13_09370 [Colwelliaceae bacterium SQ149]